MVIVFNNGGIYGGDRRQPALQEAARAGASKGNFLADPVPTAFVADARWACTSHMYCRAQHLGLSGNNAARSVCRLTSVATPMPCHAES